MMGELPDATSDEVEMIRGSRRAGCPGQSSPVRAIGGSNNDSGGYGCRVGQA